MTEDADPAHDSAPNQPDEPNPEPGRPPETRRVTATAGWIALAVAGVAALLVTLIIIGGSNSGGDSSSDAMNRLIDTFRPVKVVYELEGDAPAGADITIATPTGTSQQTTDVPMVNKNGDFGLIFHDFLAGDHVYISAQNQGSGTLTCRITVDGRVVSENTASGRYSIATCTGSA